MTGAWNLRRAILPVVVLIVAVALGGAAFVLVRNFVVCWSLTSLPGMPLPECGLSVNPLGGPNLEAGTGTPAPAAATATPQANVQELQLPRGDGHTSGKCAGVAASAGLGWGEPH